MTVIARLLSRGNLPHSALSRIFPRSLKLAQKEDEKRKLQSVDRDKKK